MRSIILGLRFSVREVIIGEAVHINIPQSSIGEYLARELVIVLMRLNPGTFESHGPNLAKPLRQSRNDIGIVWLSPPLFESRIQEVLVWRLVEWSVHSTSTSAFDERC